MMHGMNRITTSLVRAVVCVFVLCASAGSPAGAHGQATAIAPGSRVMLDAHNAYPYNGQFADRLDRALATGLPVAIEQDLVWLPATATTPARSVVSHGAPFDGTEPSLKAYFFERIRPVVESALRERDTTRWPLITLNLDLKSNEPEHHQALWTLLGEYEGWLTTAVRTADGSTAAPLDVKPVLVLTGSSDAQEQSFHTQIAVGRKLRLFGAVQIRPAATGPVLAAIDFPRATNYRRWWNAPWSVVEAGGQREAGDWTTADAERLTSVITGAHAAGLLVRMWTLNGSDEATRVANGWSAGYNFGSLEAARVRWQAAIAAKVDFVATDQYEPFARLLRR
jgi:hypothetical protein